MLNNLQIKLYVIHLLVLEYFCFCRKTKFVALIFFRFGDLFQNAEERKQHHQNSWYVKGHEKVEGWV